MIDNLETVATIVETIGRRITASNDFDIEYIQKIIEFAPDKTVNWWVRKAYSSLLKELLKNDSLLPNEIVSKLNDCLYMYTDLNIRFKSK